MSDLKRPRGSFAGWFCCAGIDLCPGQYIASA
jgi:hypothetical protein